MTNVQAGTKIALKTAARLHLIKVMEKTAAYVAMIADGNEAKILDAGFKPRNRSRRQNEGLEQVTGQRAMQGTQPGEVILEFGKVTGARLYAVEWSLDGGVTWQNGIYSSSRRVSITGMPVRQDILFRIHALGSQLRKGIPSEAARVFLV